MQEYNLSISTTISIDTIIESPQDSKIPIDTDVVPFSQHYNNYITYSISEIDLPYQIEDLDNQYKEFIELLKNLGESEDEEWKINSEVGKIARRFVTDDLWKKYYPIPEIMIHNPNSIVFVWANGEEVIYCTVSIKFISLLGYKNKKIKYRKSTPIDNLDNALPYLRRDIPSYLKSSYNSW
jgi:hypothetical protein